MEGTLMRMASKVKLLLAILLMLFAIVSIAEADTLVLPGDLTVIKESAFEGDSSLDEVILGDKVERIESRAFAGTGLHMITMPESVSYIADDAFDGVDHVKVNAPEGSYAYEWAEAKGFILNDDVTVVVASETLLAGKNLDITIYGVKNTVEHNVYLINTETDEIVYRESLKQKNGEIIFKGCRMEAGIYKMIVYTITKDMGLLKPFSQEIEVVGVKPAVLNFQLPDKMFRFEDYNFQIAPYEELYMKMIRYDRNGNLLDIATGSNF